MANYRDRRVGQEILKEVNDILRKKVRDPRVENVTITDVKVTGDLQQATIYYSILSDLASDKKKAQDGLNKASGLFFDLDESVVYGNHIDELLRDLNKD